MKKNSGELIAEAVAKEQNRIIQLMNTHRMSITPMFTLECKKCGDVSEEKPSHLMNLIKRGN